MIKRVCRLRRRRVLAESDFASLAQVVRDRREKHRFLRTAPTLRLQIESLRFKIKKQRGADRGLTGRCCRMTDAPVNVYLS